jgi:hypothetical protein
MGEIIDRILALDLARDARDSLEEIAMVAPENEAQARIEYQRAVAKQQERRQLEHKSREGFMGFIAARKQFDWHPQDPLQGMSFYSKRPRIYTAHFTPTVIHPIERSSGSGTSNFLAVPFLAMTPKDLAIPPVSSWGWDIVRSSSQKPEIHNYEKTSEVSRPAQPITEGDWLAVDRFVKFLSEIIEVEAVQQAG